jgi:hypothetical protein
MIDKYYRQTALEKYGEACEICGHRTSLEVHHIDYQEHQAMENKLRAALKHIEPELNQLIEEAKTAGYDEFDKEARSLSKNDDSHNTSVLCGNCHSLIHALDSGKKILRVLKERK